MAALRRHAIDWVDQLVDSIEIKGNRCLLAEAVDFGPATVIDIPMGEFYNLLNEGRGKLQRVYVLPKVKPAMDIIAAHFESHSGSPQARRWISAPAFAREYAPLLDEIRKHCGDVLTAELVVRLEPGEYLRCECVPGPVMALRQVLRDEASTPESVPPRERRSATA